MSAYVGQSFVTGNSTVRTLPVGATLRVSASGTLEITGIPKPVFKAGDRVRVVSMGRNATIFRGSTNDEYGLSGLPPAGSQFYVSDDAPYVVRAAKESDLRHL